jgi:hypothetical protein
MDVQKLHIHNTAWYAEAPKFWNTVLLFETDQRQPFHRGLLPWLNNQMGSQCHVLGQKSRANT